MKTKNQNSELKVSAGSELTLSKKTNILMIDPCYLFNGAILDGVWQDFCELMFPSPDKYGTNLSACGILSYNGATMLYGGTAHGDGCYGVKSNLKQQGSECGVDAGMLCFISVEDVLKINPDFKDWESGVIFSDFSGTLETDGEGLFSGSGGIKCDTKGEDEEEQATCENCGSDIDFDGATCTHCENEEE